MVRALPGEPPGTPPNDSLNLKRMVSVTLINSRKVVGSIGSDSVLPVGILEQDALTPDLPFNGVYLNSEFSQ